MSLAAMTVFVLMASNAPLAAAAEEEAVADGGVDPLFSASLGADLQNASGDSMTLMCSRLAPFIAGLKKITTAPRFLISARKLYQNS